MAFFSSLLNEFSAVWAIILFLPFFALRRHHRPLQQVVGGLEPFRNVVAEGQAKPKARPLSFWLFLLAYLIAAGCLFTVHKVSVSKLYVVDQSPSALRTGIVLPESDTAYRILGSASESVQVTDVLRALQSLPPGQIVTVWTDLSAPSVLPSWVEWVNPISTNSEEHLGVLLSAQPVDALHWRVHWALQESVVASIQSGAWDSGPLNGTEGSLLVPVSDLPQELVLAVNGKPMSTDFVGGRLALTKVEFQIPANANTAWSDAILAAWPSAKLSIGAEGDLVLNGQTAALSAFLAQLPWEREPLPEEFAVFAKTLRDAIQVQYAPRDAREFLPQPPVTVQAYAFSSEKESGRKNLPDWIRMVGWLGLICVAFAWFLMPREDQPSYSEV